MLKRSIALLLTAAAVGMAPLAWGADAPATTPRTAEAIRADLKTLEDPPLDRAKLDADASYHETWVKEVLAHRAKRIPLALELYLVSPTAPELTKLLPERWHALAAEGHIKDEVAEITAFLAAHPDSARAPTAAMTRGLTELDEGMDSAAARATAVADFEKASPSNPKLTTILSHAYAHADSAAEKDIYLGRLKKEFPTNRTTLLIEGKMNADAAVGKPFELSFEDVLTGKKVNIADYKGKVVIVDFWATWCMPCLAELPKVKAAYNQYKAQGVEMVGVTLDSAGEANIAKVKAFAVKHEMTWPQYFAGNGWDSEFSVKWGINSIPQMFVVDADGKLASDDARGKLEVLLPALLKARDQAAGQPAKGTAQDSKPKTSASAE